MSSAGVPAVALGIEVPKQTFDPLGTVGSFANIQNKLNQNRLFQQTFMARQRAGQILASSPDLDTAEQTLQRDPLVAPFAGEILNNYRQLQLTQTQLQGAQQEQASHGFEAALKVLPAVAADPSSWGKVMTGVLGTLSPVARERVAPAMEAWGQALTDGLPSDPAAAKQQFQQRMNGMLIAAGVTPEAIKGIYGTPGTLDLGGRIQPTLTAPAAIGGGMTAVGSPFGKTLAPTTVDIAGVPVVIGGGAGGGGGAPSGNPLMPRGAATPQAVAAPAAAAAAGGLAGDGKPLFEGIGTAPSVRPGGGIAGVNVLSPAQQQQAKDMMAEFGTRGAKEFDNAQQVLGSLRYVDNALDTLAKGGGFTVPGTAATARVNIAKTINTLAQMSGGKPSFDPVKIASAEDIAKETKRLGFTVVNQMLGGQREAASTIENAISSVPGIENSYLGGKVLTDSIRAAAQRAIDQWNFQTEWAARNQGNLAGSLAAFNTAHPAEQYVDKVLSKYGMSEGGFNSPADVKRSVAEGYLTKEQAVKILTKQFGGGTAGRK